MYYISVKIRFRIFNTQLGLWNIIKNSTWYVLIVFIGLCKLQVLIYNSHHKISNKMKV